MLKVQVQKQSRAIIFPYRQYWECVELRTYFNCTLYMTIQFLVHIANMGFYLSFKTWLGHLPNTHSMYVYVYMYVCGLSTLILPAQ